MPPARTLSRNTSSAHASCRFGRCSVSGSRPQVIKHEVHEHFSRRFFCCACDKTLSSFESLRTHANSQHYRNRLFKCETCKTTYLDPARLAKCRKRHRGQFRCPEPGCQYHNARKNSVVRHLRTQHHYTTPNEDTISFDDTLCTAEPPKQRRVGSTSSSASSVPGNVDASFLNLTAAGPTDEALFRMSEDKRRVEMEKIRREHIQWMGSEEALLRAVPDYPAWTQREHPYGRTPSAEPESRESDESASTPEVLVSSPMTTGWGAQAESPSAGSSSGSLMPSISLEASSPQWSGVKHHSYSDVPLANYTSPSLPFPLTSTPSLVPDTLSVPSLEGPSLFSPHMASPLLSPWDGPSTPPLTQQSLVPTAIMYDIHTPSSSFGSSQFSDDSADGFLFPSPAAPAFEFFQQHFQQQAFVPEVKTEYSVLFPDFLETLSEV